MFQTKTQSPLAGSVQLPPFLEKLVEILETPRFQSVIRWMASGQGFEVLNTEKILDVVNQYFSHSCYRSFQRQLNMYGFLRTRNRHEDREEFTHPLFNRYRPQDIARIERKKYLKKRGYKAAQKQHKLPVRKACSQRTILVSLPQLAR